MAKKQNSIVIITIKGAKPDQNPSIPAGGQIQFNNVDSEYTSLSWEDEKGNGGTFWSPQPTNMPTGSNGAQTAQALAKKKTLKYTFAGRINTGGSGTVKVGS